MLAPYPADNRQQSTKNFELDRSISHTKQQQGRLNRLSVAVVVDDQVKINPANGETSRAPWSAAELARFTRLVQVRSEERRVGKECVSTGRSRRSRSHSNKKTTPHTHIQPH